MARLLSMPGSGSVKHPSTVVMTVALGSLLSPHRERRGFKMLNAGLPLASADSREFIPGSAKLLVSLRAVSSNHGVRSDHLILRPESRQDYPPNLSILISGGKENNCDALSNGE